MLDSIKLAWVSTLSYKLQTREMKKWDSIKHNIDGDPPFLSSRNLSFHKISEKNWQRWERYVYVPRRQIRQMELGGSLL